MTIATDAETYLNDLARRVARGRDSVAGLFGLTMRHEKTNRLLSLAAHQRLKYEFIEAHELCVVRAPTGTGKTFDHIAEFLYALALDPSERIAVVSAAQGQAAKIVQTAGRYISESAELHLAFPDLVPSERSEEPWTQTAITVKRQTMARDASLAAFGYGGQLPGSRFTRVLLDDMLNADNTATVEGRKDMFEWVNSTVLSRRGAERMRVTCTNVPWHPGSQSKDSEDGGDLTFALARLGWAVLNMDIEGNVWFENTDWDSDLIRPSEKDPEGKMHRLTEHDSPAYARLCGIQVPAGATEWKDSDNEVPLWPEVMPRAEIEHDRKTMSGPSFEQNRMIRVRSDEDSVVKAAWIERCKFSAANHVPSAVRSLVTTGSYPDPFPTFTGVDPGWTKKKKSNYSAIVTFSILPGGFRRFLNVRFDKWSPKQMKDALVSEVARFNSMCFVEDNNARDAIKEWVQEQHAALVIRSLWTGKNKWDFQTGVQGMLGELESGAWLIPNDSGALEPNMKELVTQMLFFTRDRKVHTGDVLMAWWIGWEGARKHGFLKPGHPLSPHSRDEDIRAALAALRR